MKDDKKRSLEEYKRQSKVFKRQDDIDKTKDDKPKSSVKTKRQIDIDMKQAIIEIPSPFN